MAFSIQAKKITFFLLSIVSFLFLVHRLNGAEHLVLLIQNTVVNQTDMNVGGILIRRPKDWLLLTLKKTKNDAAKLYGWFPLRDAESGVDYVKKSLFYATFQKIGEPDNVVYWTFVDSETRNAVENSIKGLPRGEARHQKVLGKDAIIVSALSKGRNHYIYFPQYGVISLTNDIDSIGDFDPEGKLTQSPGRKSLVDVPPYGIAHVSMDSTRFARRRLSAADRIRIACIYPASMRAIEPRMC